MPPGPLVGVRRVALEQRQALLGKAFLDSICIFPRGRQLIDEAKLFVQESVQSAKQALTMASLASAVSGCLSRRLEIQKSVLWIRKPVVFCTLRSSSHLRN